MAKRKKSSKVIETTKLEQFLIPKHSVLSEKDKKKLFETYKLTIQELPKILTNDPALRHLSVKEGDVVKIERENPVTGKSLYYRGVINA